jgi:hypothetical protein
MRSAIAVKRRVPAPAPADGGAHSASDAPVSPDEELVILQVT